jgi:integrase
MSDITTVEVVAKREDATIEPIGRRTRKGTVLTDRPCETRVKTRKKYYDRRTRGLYVSITPGGIATFAVNYTDAAGRPTSRMLGVYSETFKVAHARAEVAALKAKGGGAIGEQLRQRQAKAATQGITVAQLIEKRIEFMSTEEMKDDGKKRPRIESWEGVARHLRNFVSPKLGHMVAKEVTADDIATLSNDIRDGNHGGKPSPSNARHARRACSAMFKWAMQPGSAGKDSAGRGIRFLDDIPCRNLPKLKKERPKTRVLTKDEIRTLWHGLDREDLPSDRTTRLAIKFALVTMLRSNEMLPIRRSELENGAGSNGAAFVNIPAERVKKRRLIRQPLSDLALEILKEAVGDNEYAFTGRFGDAPLSRQAMSNSLRGSKRGRKGGQVVETTPGICELLGLKPFTPHDLRRTAATMCEHLRLPGGDIALCLDHQSSKDENGNDWPVVTQEVYSLAFEARVARKRDVLDAWAAELRLIVGTAEENEQRLAA